MRRKEASVGCSNIEDHDLSFRAAKGATARVAPKRHVAIHRMASIAQRIAANPYDARRSARVFLPSIAYHPDDMSAAAVQMRGDALRASIESQGPETGGNICKLGEDGMSYVYNRLHLSTNGKTSIPSLVSVCQANKACKFFSYCFKNMKTEIDASRVDRIDGNDAVSGPDDRNLHKSRFVLREIIGGRSILLKAVASSTTIENAPDGARLLIYRDMDPESEKRYTVVYALAVPTPAGFVCTPFDLDTAVQLFSGHDTKHGVFHIEDLKIKRAKTSLLPTFEDNEIEEQLFVEMYSAEEKMSDVSNIFINVHKTNNIFDGYFSDAPVAPITISTSFTTCVPLSCKSYCMATDDFRSICDFLGYADPCVVARCRVGADEDDCYIKLKHTIESYRAPTPKVKEIGKVDTRNIKPTGMRRLTGARGDMRSYITVAALDSQTTRGRLKRTAPQWSAMKESENEFNRQKIARGEYGNYKDARFAHDTDSENEDELEEPQSDDEQQTTQSSRASAQLAGGSADALLLGLVYTN